MSRIDDLVTGLLKEIGKDPEREGLRQTPRRFRRSLEIGRAHV